MQRTSVSFCSGYDQLRGMPRMVRAVLSGVTEEEARWKPVPERWSAMQVLGHLAHVEIHGFRGRVLRMLREDHPRIESYDPDTFAAAGVYDGAGIADAIDAFARERGLSLAMLRTLSPAALSRGGVHAELGEITIGALINEWPFHDLGHLRQIAELVRAVKFYPHMGAWQRFYTVSP
jgi:hypothetical protein